MLNICLSIRITILTYYSQGRGKRLYAHTEIETYLLSYYDDYISIYFIYFRYSLVE